ncbi:MAG: ATPase, partial [Bdellovibrionales bacterium]
CGSVSSWIEENIVKNANFVGRVSLEINLKELSLSEANHFWDFQKDSKISSYEKLKILSITGGVPKYLEELVKKGSTESTIIKQCFHESGFLFNEYDKIFSEIFMRKAPALEKIIRQLIKKKYQPTNLAHTLKLNLNSVFSNQLEMLILSGFCEKDASYLIDGERSKLNWIRLKDNYLRFYLNYIEPLKSRIHSGSTKIQTLDQLKNWDGLMGLQFENVLLNSREAILPFLDLDFSDIITASPYFQKKSTRTKGATQVDLLIHTRRDVFFLCEFKCVKVVDRSIIPQILKKMNVIKIPKRAALRPVLVYEGQIHPNDEAALKSFFDTIIHFSELMQ